MLGSGGEDKNETWASSKSSHRTGTEAPGLHSSSHYVSSLARLPKSRSQDLPLGRNVAKPYPSLKLKKERLGEKRFPLVGKEAQKAWVPVSTTDGATFGTPALPHFCSFTNSGPSCTPYPPRSHRIQLL